MGSLVTRGMVIHMMGSIPIPNTRFYLTSIDGKKWFVTEYYKTAPFNPAKETYDLNKAYGNGLSAGRHSVDFG